MRLRKPPARGRRIRFNGTSRATDISAGTHTISVEFSAQGGFLGTDTGVLHHL